MEHYSSRADRDAVEAECSWAERGLPNSIYQVLERTRKANGPRNAITFQLESGPKDRAETLHWDDFHAEVTRAANLFRSLGIGQGDVIACVLPNCNEMAVALIAGATAGIVNPINPLLDAEQIGAILHETKARAVVTLRAFPQTDVAQKVAAALAWAPDVKTVLEVDLLHYLDAPKRWIVPFVRPSNRIAHSARVLDMRAEMARQPADALTFAETGKDRVAAMFHTGGTTGMPKVAQHKMSGMVYNGWLGDELLFVPGDTLICPLPLFHVFAAYPVLMSVISSGAHVVFPTPQGYRGKGVFDNFWKLVERWRGTFVIIVPTAVAALMQRPVNADISSLRMALSGSSPLPIELINRFRQATGLDICEGYGLTEATCLVSINPPDGIKKHGSVGLPFPYTDVRILHLAKDGSIDRTCEVDEIGEICVSSPGVFEGSTYTEEAKNLGLYAEGRYLRTGDLGRLDADGYLFITGRAKDLIIRGGHNIDPAGIEEALLEHPAVAFAAAIGQPDGFAGELPCAYVELVAGAQVDAQELIDFAAKHVHERAAIPKHVEILDELPKTAVGKVFKPDLRKLAIRRVYDEVLAEAGLNAHVAQVVEDRKRGLVAQIAIESSSDEARMSEVLGAFTIPWQTVSPVRG